MKPVTDVAVIVIKYLDNPKINTNYIDLSLRNPMHTKYHENRWSRYRDSNYIFILHQPDSVAHTITAPTGNAAGQIFFLNLIFSRNLRNRPKKYIQIGLSLFTYKIYIHKNVYPKIARLKVLNIKCYLSYLSQPQYTIAIQ